MDIKNFDLRIFVTEENLPNSDIPLYALTAYDGETGDVKFMLECLSEKEIRNMTIADMIECIEFGEG